MLAKGPKISSEAGALNFDAAKILACFTIKLDDTINFVMIAKGNKLKSSIVILDSELKVKDTPSH